jgi:hypothetical protein
MKIISLFLLITISFKSFAGDPVFTEKEIIKIMQCKGLRKCVGDTGYGGVCYNGHGGPLYAGYGGPCYDGAGGPLNKEYGGKLYAGYGGNCNKDYGGPCFEGYGGNCYSGYGATGDKCPSQCFTVCD